MLNAYGDAACALTPLRIGGEPARLAGMLQSRVPATAAFVAISLEVLAAWPVIIVAAGWVAWRYAPSWWAMAGPRLADAAADAWPWVVLVTVVSVAVWWYARRVTSPAVRHIRRPVRRAMVYWRRMPRVAAGGEPAAQLPQPRHPGGDSSGAGLDAAQPPELGPMVLGSFALLYSQMLLPTPSGAGAVDLGFLGGAAGDLGTRSGGCSWPGGSTPMASASSSGIGAGGARLWMARPPAASAAVERSRLAGPCAPAPRPPRAGRRRAPRRSRLPPPPASRRPR